MKLKPLLLTVLFFLAHCSFDNKTGIWKDASIIGVEQDNDKDIKDIEANKKDFDKNFTRIFTEESQFNNAKKVEPGTLIALNNPINIKNWLETYYNSENNPSNIFYKNNKKNIFKSKSLAKFPNKIKNNYNKLTHPLFYKNKIISYDHKGTVYIYSIENKKKILTYNFYKKKFKKIEKKLFFLIKNDIIYVADNLGYLYAININSSKLIWAKNYGVPFRSNIKSNIDTLFLANLDNVIFAVNVSNGKKNGNLPLK